MLLKLKFMKIVLEYIYKQNKYNCLGAECKCLIEEIDLELNKTNI